MGRRPWPWPRPAAGPHSPGLDDARAHWPGGLPRLRTEADLLRQVPVVLLTSRAEEDIAAGFAAGATDYLTKPFRPSHVRSRVRAGCCAVRTGRHLPSTSRPERLRGRETL